MEPGLRLAHLYPKQMNLYGDRGNILCLRRRCAARGIELAVDELEVGEPLDPTGYDLIFIGGAQDREQRRVAADLLAAKGDALRQAVDARRGGAGRLRRLSAPRALLPAGRGRGPARPRHLRRLDGAPGPDGQAVHRQRGGALAGGRPWWASRTTAAGPSWGRRRGRWRG